MIIIARGLQGIGAASTIPNAVALILRNYKIGRERNQAMSFFASTGAIGFVVGLIIGGAVTESPLGWRWLFYISAMISGLMAVISILVIPSKSEEDDNDDAPTISTEKKTIDIFGAGLSTASMLLLVYVLTDGNASGWANPRIISLLIVSVLLLVAFIVVEFKIRQPLMPPWIWTLPNFAPAFVIASCVMGYFQGYMYFVTLIFQDVFHYSALGTAVHYLPLGIIASIMGVASEKIIHRFNIKVALMAGLFIGTIGNVIIGFYYTEDQYWSRAFPSFVVGVAGLSTVYASVMIAAIGRIQFHLSNILYIDHRHLRLTQSILFQDAAPKSEAGIVGGLLNTAFQIGGGLGLAILTAVDTSVNTPGTTGADLMKGYHAALWTGTGIIGLALIVAILFIRSKPNKNREQENIKVVVVEETPVTAEKQMEEGNVSLQESKEEENTTVIGDEDITDTDSARRK
ncbi:major facilitator superfamily domain-containing protein [Jimgerdemannia flammicorona]|uniref:Major facilitator superfamily domain-containing protein n=1 Tax=Jimgerdemannia flammicorona TaxID=994334 RepID=A0A433QUQ6_9FUNG|nr:major facilitator superfamily domain-containing protein [Jimgerdemannia flammicorona]